MWVPDVSHNPASKLRLVQGFSNTAHVAEPREEAKATLHVQRLHGVGGSHRGRVRVYGRLSQGRGLDTLLTILGQSREARARPGLRDHESAANRRDLIRRSDPPVDARGLADVRTRFARIPRRGVTRPDSPDCDAGELLVVVDQFGPESLRVGPGFAALRILNMLRSRISLMTTNQRQTPNMPGMTSQTSRGSAWSDSSSS